MFNSLCNSKYAFKFNDHDLLLNLKDTLLIRNNYSFYTVDLDIISCISFEIDAPESVKHSNNVTTCVGGVTFLQGNSALTVPITKSNTIDTFETVYKNSGSVIIYTKTGESLSFEVDRDARGVCLVCQNYIRNFKIPESDLKELRSNCFYLTNNEKELNRILEYEEKKNMEGRLIEFGKTVNKEDTSGWIGFWLAIIGIIILFILVGVLSSR